MKEKENKKRIIELNIDLGAVITGFGTAQKPTPAHHRIVKHYSSPLLLGPPRSELLLEMIMHMFTEDEADLVQYLPPLWPRTAESIARRSGRSLVNVKRVMDNLALNKFVILAFGEPRKYTILPIVPGTFEMSLMTPDLSTRNAWHKKFAELFERLWDEGFLAEYLRRGHPLIRYIPVGGVVNTLNMAWPSDRLEEILEPYDLFAVGNCQCRLAMELTGRGCGKPMENCVAIGPSAKSVIERGMMRKAGKEEIIEIKREAEQQDCVTWMMNEIGDRRGTASCSCCGCCCHALRAVTQFNTPNIISRPHFIPVLNGEKCTLCRRCVEICPMNAWTMHDNILHYAPVRCIGCGLCALACGSGAIQLEPAPDARPPEAGWLKLLLKTAPGYAATTLRVWASRFMSGL